MPTTFGDHLFQLRRLGESDLTTLMAHLDNEDKLWVEREMQSASASQLASFANTDYDLALVQGRDGAKN